MNADQRREALIKAAGGNPLTGEMLPLDEAEPAVDNLLAYFNEHEPAVADAIRYGLRRSGFDSGAWHINYPEGHPKR